MCLFRLTDDPADWLTMTGKANTAPAAGVGQNISKVVASFGYRNRKTLHT
jgi:hypothetical protein